MNPRLSSSFRCDQSHKYLWFDFGHTCIAYVWIFTQKRAS